MQEYGGSVSNKRDYHECEGRECSQDNCYSVNQRSFFQKGYGCPNKELIDQNITSYCRVAIGTESTHQQHSRYTNTSAPTFSSPPNSPLVGLVFDPSSPNYPGSGIMNDRLNPERRSQSSWSISHQEPIGTGVKKKIVKSYDKRNSYSADPRYQDKYKDTSTETEYSRKKDRNLRSESTSSLDFFAEGERMVSELCNIPDTNPRNESNCHKSQKGPSQDQDERNRHVGSDILLTALDKIIIHDQIPNQIVQLAIEACTDAENIAIAHHNRPCFKNIHSICAKTRSNVQKPDSAVANLHSQGIPWVIKNFIFSFVRILDGWKGVKELLSEKHDTFSRIENKYYSQNIRECFVQWQAVTKEMLTHIYKTFKCLDHGFTMEQKSFTHNYYATNSAAPRHQNQNKFQSIKQHIAIPRPINPSPSYNVIQPPWLQPQTPSTPQNFSENSWPMRSNVTYKKIPIVASQPPQNFYTLNDQSDVDNFQKAQYKCDPYCIRESKPRQSWTITNIPECRIVEGVCHSDQRELYSQLKHKMDAELGKTSSQPIMSNTSCDLLQRRELEVKAKMVPLSHVEKNLIPSMSSSVEIRNCYAQKNHSCGDTKEEADFFAAWGQMVQKEPSDFLTHHTHNIQIPSNVVTISNNISGPVQFIETENDEFHEMSKVYMKPGSYKVPIKPVESVASFLQSTTQDMYDNHTEDTSVKPKVSYQQVTLAPQPKYNLEAWPCLMSKRADDVLMEEHKLKPTLKFKPCLDIRAVEALDILSSMMSDKAWEAAKQSAPKLMDFIHEGSRSDTARLYDALGLGTNGDDLARDLTQLNINKDPNELWTENTNVSKPIPSCVCETSNGQDCCENPSNENILSSEEKIITNSTERGKVTDINNEDECASKSEKPKESTRPRNFDQSGNYVKDENQKKSSGKSKVAVSGTWYHPKKKKPLSSAIVKKFENLLHSLSQLQEAAFIQKDMDMKVAPRFYEVVKYPMSLNDISTKLSNSSYTEADQVVQDFRRIFNNVRLYLKSYPDTMMKKNVNKVSSEFEKKLTQEFQNKSETKAKSQENDAKEQNNKKIDKDNVVNRTEKREEHKSDHKFKEDKHQA